MGTRFEGICIVTDDMVVLRDFYQEILQAEVEGDETHARLLLEGADLTLLSKAGMEAMAPGSTEGVGSGGYTVEIEVSDVNDQYERLRDLGVDIVKPPTTYPWGRRSFWFGDPDGNIMNFFSHVAAASVVRSERPR